MEITGLSGAWGSAPRGTTTPSRAPHLAWVDAIVDAMRPWRTGAEVNRLGDEGGERVRFAYGDTHPRLTALKRIWDPGNMFRLNQNVPPA